VSKCSSQGTVVGNQALVRRPRVEQVLKVPSDRANHLLLVVGSDLGAGNCIIRAGGGGKDAIEEGWREERHGEAWIRPNAPRSESPIGLSDRREILNDGPDQTA
jgi:hypothetical protein